MSFDNPRFLFFLLALLPLAAVMFIRRRKRRRELHVFASNSPAGEPESFGGRIKRLLSLSFDGGMAAYRSRMLYADFSFVLFLGFCIAALAGPRWGEETIADYSRGVDVVLAFDISRSMNVRDCPPLLPDQEQSSRLERALATAHELGLGLDGMRAGVAVGKGRGVLTLPLTYDYEVVLNFLSGVNQFSLTGGGTNLESLIDAASEAFKDNMPGRRGIIIFSDGEELSGSVQAAADRAQSRRIVICAAGMGSDQGGTVPLDDGTLLSKDGSPVISARKSETLRLIAEKSGGIYVDGGRQDAAARIGTFLRSLSTDSLLLGRRKEPKSQSHVLILAALACFGLSRLMGFSSRRKNPAAAGASSGALCIALLAGLVLLSGGSCSRAEGKILVMQGNYYQNRGDFTEAVSAYLRAATYPDSALYAEYGLGSAYFALEESRIALERYKSADESLDALPRELHPELRFRIKYNTGIIHFEQGDYAEAAKAFRSALEIDGGKIEAKRNLELSLLSMAPLPNSEPAPENMQEDTGENGSDESAEPSGATLVLFEYLRRREQEQWRSREWTGETGFSGLDY